MGRVGSLLSEQHRKPLEDLGLTGDIRNKASEGSNSVDGRSPELYEEPRVHRNDPLCLCTGAG